MMRTTQMYESSRPGLLGPQKSCNTHERITKGRFDRNVGRPFLLLSSVEPSAKEIPNCQLLQVLIELLVIEFE